MNKSSFLILGAALANANCGTIKPSKNPAALAMDLPLEQASPASSGAKTPEQTANAFSPETMQTVSSTRYGVSAACAELEDCEAAEKNLYLNSETENPVDEQHRQIRNRCLVLMLNCEKENRSSR